MAWPKRKEQIGIGRIVKGCQDRRSSYFLRMGRWRVELRKGMSETG